MSQGGGDGGGGRGRGRGFGYKGADSWAMPRRGGRGGYKAALSNPHGADLTKYMKRGAPKPDFKRSRAPEPTVDQIQVYISLSYSRVEKPNRYFNLFINILAVLI